MKTMAKRMGTAMAALMAAVTLTACGGGGGGGTSSDGREYPSGPDDTVAKRIDDARTLARATTFTARAVGHDVTAADPDGTGDFRAVNNRRATPENVLFRIYRAAPDEAATVAVTHRGETTTFTPDTMGRTGYRVHDPSAPENIDAKVFWAYGGWLSRGFGTADGTPDTEYHVPVEFWFDGTPDDPTNMNRLAVIGLETRPGDMPGGTVAEYRGEVRMEVRPKEAPGGWTRYRSDIGLTADFSKGTVSGEMDNLARWSIDGDGQVEEEPLAGLSYRLVDAPVTDSGFTTEMAPGADCADCLDIVSSEVIGAFYGPAADEAGGTIEVEFDDGASPRIGAGVFSSSKRENEP